ncbi:hypothetical protein P175DRAFT_0489359 [Aspergillus ochraceoroseus IBT 24754]|uniref:non-specific serine/threonine protein kinase n=2 Tax=Aspergillus ochraceoroseus TaxID=138278 RepID=A0A2T5M6R9_9EURO|nr:uncharacterized protein P175DRAFT_0489359 [Aspergillus ochraceoroseus IBT 24754]PTU24228.1 hypothetical protein P175DRAFT_0489359 [Aspergillus ochraceoroseus IBT 24754]
MMTLSPQTLSCDTNPRRHTAGRAASTNTAGKRKVYGKRKADAPKAVFEQNSPRKSGEKTGSAAIQDAVDVIQAKLADVQIDETPTTELARADIKETSKAANQINTIEKTPSSDPKPPKASEPTEISPPTHTPVVERRYQTMVEVRIAPRDITQSPQVQQKESTNPESVKRAGRKKKPIQRLSSGCVSDDIANAYVRPILNGALAPSAAQSIQKFDSWAARAGTMFEVVKLAEGSYGEVYKLRLREDICQSEMSKSKLARLRAYGDGVFKVVPLRAQKGAGSKKFTSIEELVAEVKMLKYLDPIPGFARFRDIHVVQGRFPESFQKAWEHYRKTKDDCLNPNPSSKRAYPDTQIWAIVEMDDAGCELEKFSWSSIFQVYDIFWGVAMALARAEEYALFEHRDLHLGNVCIKSTRPDGRMDPPTDLETTSQSSQSGFGLSTLETTIIDYSLSRAELIVDEASTLTEVTSSDLDKKQIFDAVGQDEDEILLRDTYRHMRAQVYKGSPVDTEKTPDIPGIWSEYAPRTNLIWLRFLLKNLLKNKKPESLSRPPLAPCSPNKEINKQASKSGKRGETTKGPLSPGAQARVSQLKHTLEERLNATLELLDLEHGHEDMCCAADLVAFAIDAQWLDEKDFF